ncbi:MAG: amidase family protein [Caldilineaceae bacterium]
MLGPLHGIPVLLKDNVGTGGTMQTTAGAVAMADAHCDRDAFIVTQLRAAGAVILGKTNLSEWANYMTSDSNNGFSAGRPGPQSPRPV